MYKSLAEYFEKEFKVKIKDKACKKQVCPACTKETFNIYDNGNRAKCFHPNCGKHFNLNLINYGFNYKSVIAEEIYKDFKAFFLADKNHMPYSFCTTRGITPRIIEQSELGAVPFDYDSNKIFNRVIDEIEEKIRQNDSVEKNKAKLEEIKELKIKFKNWTEQNAGNLCFFYRDQHGVITQIRARKPFSKFFTTFKFGKKSGVFNAIPMSENVEFNTHLFVTEGEFNELQLQSVCDANLLSVPSCAVGGANTVDYETLFALGKEVVIIYDNDDAGLEVLKKAKEINAVYGITTPEKDSDLDEYLKTFQNKKEAYSAFVKLASQAKKHFRSLKSIKNQVKEIMNTSPKEMKTAEKKEAVAKLAISEIQQRYVFYKDHNYSYLFSEETKRIISLSEQSKELRHLFVQIGINPAENIYNYVLEELLTYAYINAQQVEIHKYAYYDKKNYCLYIYNNQDRIFKITVDKITEINNGDEGILFLYDPSAEPFEIVEIDKNLDYLDEFIFSKMHFDCEESDMELNQQKGLFRCWFFSTFFESIMSTKVLLLILGEKGSGKTYGLRILGKVLFGSKYEVSPMPNKPDDFDTIVSNSHYCVFDNADNTFPWLNDKLACVATGQVIKKRRLYSDNETVEMPVKCFVALTSREPNFTRDDIADRLICISLKRFEKFLQENNFIENILENRNKIMSYILSELHEIIKALYAERETQYETEFRIADFAAFGLCIADYKNKKGEFEETLKTLINVQSNFTMENAPLMEVLTIWLHADNQRNVGRPITGNQLFKELKELANILVPSFYYKSTGSMMKRLNNLRQNIKEEITFTRRAGHANQYIYEFLLLKIDDKLKNIDTTGKSIL